MVTENKSTTGLVYLTYFFFHFFADREKIKEALHQLLEKLKKVKSKHKSVEKLSIFSPWLAQYHWYGCDNFIEFPGQHKNDTPPNPNTSLKIVKFLENVSICHSLRKPIKISAICSDGSIRSFLVKYGEDLRQDERIQHIQELMSDQMKLDRNCSQQQLSLQIYKVIPLNTHCGLISWIENTDSIQSFLSSSDPKWDIVNTKVRKSFEDFISDGAKHMKKAIPHVGAVLHYKASMVSKAIQKNIGHNLCVIRLPSSFYRLHKIWKNYESNCQKMA